MGRARARYYRCVRELNADDRFNDVVPRYLYLPWNLRCVKEARLKESAASLGITETALGAEVAERRHAPSDWSGLQTVRAVDIPIVPIRWLWPGKIPVGKITLLVGDPGLGKSLISVDFAARVSNGFSWPDGKPCDIGEVLFISAEDDPGDTICARLTAAGADMSRITIEKGGVAEPTSGEAMRKFHSFSLQRDIAALSVWLRANPRCRLLIIDPVSAYLGDIDRHRNSDVRALLGALAETASDHNAAVLLISHLNKNGKEGNALYRTTGSLAFVAAARAAFLVAGDPDCPKRKLLLPLKHNLAEESAGLAYTVFSVSEGQAPSLTWEKAPVTIRANDVPVRKQEEDREYALEDACEFLTFMLEKGPMQVTDLQKEAKAAGHAWPTVQRAKGKVGVASKKSDFHKGWRWHLTGGYDDPAEPAT